MTLTFPPSFRWGAATAAYQIEGAVDEDGRTPSIWDTFAHRPGAVVRGDTGDIACDHYHRWRDDLDLLEDLGVNAYRMSVAWPRVVPELGGPVNARGLDFYEGVVDDLLARGIAPVVTLYHWDLPQYLQDVGGWANRDTTQRFADYTDAVAARLGDRVPFWITLNEPYCAAFVGHLEGRHAPGVRDEAVAVAAAHHLLLAHGLGVQRLRARGVVGDVGITCNLTAAYPASDEAADVAAARRLDLYENRLFLDPLFRGHYPEDAPEYYRGISDFGFVRDGDLATIAAPLDFLGVNYYEQHAVRADQADPVRGWQRVPDAEQTIVGIGVHPEGLVTVLTRVARDYTPIPLMVTETGIALHDYVDPEG
ncbi:MAG: family 1 glycosylhydrolase, partial [Micrococcales bacterium]|nr:family 1 glycosylhydrolase [Micrococcales bacterium]